MPVTLFALLLIVVSSVAWSVLDLQRKVLAGRMSPVPLLFLLTTLPLPLFLAWIWADGWKPVAAGYYLPGLASVALNVLANVAFLRSVRLSPLSVTIPLLSLTPVFTTLMAVPVLGERPTLRQALGILVVVAGALVLNLRTGEGSSLADFWRAFRREPGSPLMAFVAFVWSMTPPLDKLAMSYAGAPLHATVLNAGVAAAMLVVLLAQRRLGELRALRRSLVSFLVAVAAAGVGLAGQLVAIGLVQVGLVEALKRGIGFALAVTLGRLVFAETITPHKLIAVAMMIAGVAMILL